MTALLKYRLPSGWILLAALLLTALVYWPGLSGGFLFDDYPNIVDNHGVQPADASLSSLVRAALSSPASDFKRPLASLSFAANYLTTGLNPYWMKLTNLFIHLLNGWLTFILVRQLLNASAAVRLSARSRATTAAFIAAGWLLLPINVTGVLYVVQRMESLANLFVLAGLIGYIAGREKMRRTASRAGLVLSIASLLLATALGLLAKETAVMLPLYAFLVEAVLFRFETTTASATVRPAKDRVVQGLFLLVLAVPLAVGLIWLVPGLLRPSTWANRDFTLGTRLLSEARIVVDYIAWVILPTPEALSFYHDDFHISTGLLSPWTTLASMLVIALLIAAAFKLRTSRPLIALGIALFLGAQLLTSTILPLELIYEHRNYFASLGLLLAIVPAIVEAGTKPESHFGLLSKALLVCLLAWWAALTVITAKAWASPVSLAEELALRAPASPRAQYELGRTYIIYSRYDPASPFIEPAREALERSAALPGSSILPEQALIFMYSRMDQPLKPSWWESMNAKLAAHRPGVQDESSLAALTQCAREGQCKLPLDRMSAAYLAALSHPSPSARLLSMYADYAWNLLDDHELGLRMITEAIQHAPREPAYRITQIRMLVANEDYPAAERELAQLRMLNIGGYLDESLRQLEGSIRSTH